MIKVNAEPYRTVSVVCLCGSAGALEAYRKILRALPADTDMALVIATHLGDGTSRAAAPASCRGDRHACHGNSGRAASGAEPDI